MTNLGRIYLLDQLGPKQIQSFSRRLPEPHELERNFSGMIVQRKWCDRPMSKRYLDGWPTHLEGVPNMATAPPFGAIILLKFLFMGWPSRGATRL